jgi:peptide/nickel transport system ATP-binding protein
MLIRSIPSLTAKQLFRGIPGMAPSLLSPPPGCAFHPRCQSAMPRCAELTPQLTEVRPGRWVSCLLYEGTPYEDTPHAGALTGGTP